MCSAPAASIITALLEMRPPLKISWSSFLQPLLRILKMSNRTSSHIELANSEPVPVAVYCQFLQSLYTTKEESRALRIVGIDLMKNVKKGAEHESLRATVRDCQGVLWYVYFERMRGPIAAPAPPSHATQSDTNLPRQQRNRSSFRISSPFHSSPSPSPSPSSSHSSSSLASSDSFSKDHNASDVVTPLGKPSRQGEHSVLYLEFEENKGPFLYELAVLAATLHTSMTTYRLLSRNCYWYSGLLLNLLEMRHGLKAATKGGRHGTWKRYVRLYQQAEEAELRPVIDTFHFDLEAFEKTVSIPFLSIPKTMAHFPLRLRKKREDS